MNDIGARIGFNQDGLREAGLAEMTAVWNALVVGPDVTTSLIRVDAVGVGSVARLAFFPVFWLKTEGAHGAWHGLGAF